MRTFITRSVFTRSIFTRTPIIAEAAKLQREDRLEEFLARADYAIYRVFIETPPLEKRVLTKLFYKSQNVLGHGTMRLNNASGYAIVGRTSYPRRFATVSPHLLPNVISAYVDYEIEKHLTPYDLLVDSCHHAGIFTHNARCLNSLLGLLQLEGVVVMFCADGISGVYSNSKIWSEFHALISSCYTVVLLSDSSPNLKALIESESNQEQIRSMGFTTIQPSLNSTKIQLYYPRSKEDI